MPPHGEPVSTPAVGAVIVTFEGRDRIDRCVDAVKASDYPRLDVVVVDNGSVDSSVDGLAERHPGIRIVRVTPNQGFSRGALAGHQAVVEAGAELVWFLNDDARPSPDALPLMVRALAKDPGLGAITPKIYEARGGTRLRGDGRVSFWSGLSHSFEESESGPTHYLNGVCLMIRSEALGAEPPFDPGFFLYWEDTDLGFRLRRRGWRLGIAEGGFVEHDGAATVPFRSLEWDRRFTASSIRFFRRHASAPWIPIGVSIAGRVIKRLAAGRWGNAKAVLRGAVEGWWAR